MKTRTLSPVVALIFAFAVGGVGAADIQLPQENVELRPSPLAGYVVAMQKCAICHSPDYVAYQPPSMTQAQWTAEMTKMQRAYGAPISDDEVRQLGAYLAVAYGSAKASDPAVIDASKATASPAPTAAKPSADDVAALLASNGCLACHASDHRIFGPAYHDVAARYKSQPQALATVSKSIVDGGSGHWGTVSMPPFPGLSDADVRALAGYVLEQ